jgi:streptogramin lyase
MGNRIGRLSGSTINEWKILTLGSEPWDIVVDDEENVWFTQYNAHSVARFKSGVLVEFKLANDNRFPTGITVDNDPEHQNIWFTELGGGGVNGRIGRIYYNDTSGLKNWILTEYELPSLRRPYDIAVSPVNGFVWYTDQGTHDIACFNPWTTQITEYDISSSSGLLTGSFMLWGITVDQDGFVWAAVDIDDGEKFDKICRLNPWTGEVIFYSIPTKNAGPRILDVDSDGHLWITLWNPSKVARLSPIDQYITEYETPTSGSNPYGIAVKSNSIEVFFTEWAANKIGKLNPDIGKNFTTVTTITSATTSTIQSITTVTSPPVTSTTKTLYSIHTTSTLNSPSTVITASPTVTYWTASNTNSTDFLADRTTSTNTETVLVMPTSRTATTTSFIVSTSTTSTTKTDTSTTFVSTTSTTTTTTESATFFTPITTESTSVTRLAIFTDVVETTTLTEYAETRFRDATVTEQVYTDFSTSTEATTVTSFTTTTVTTLIFFTITAGLGWAAPLIAASTLTLLWLKRRRSSK